jgi:hypothetical protein
MEPYNENENIMSYRQRNKLREDRLFQATVNFIDYFVNLGDDISIAQDKVSQLSTEVSQYTYIYILGNTRPLITAINDSVLPFMDGDAKNKITNDLLI